MGVLDLGHWVWRPLPRARAATFRGRPPKDLVVGTSATNIPSSAKVDPALVEACDIARCQLKSIMDSAGADTADLMQKHLDSARAKLLCIDRDFHIELSLFDLLAGASSETRLMTHILAAMPSQTSAADPETTLQALTQMSRQEVTKFATRPAQSTLR